MRTTIVDLDRARGRSAPSSADRGVIAALFVACVAFAVAVWLARPATPIATPNAAPPDTLVSAYVPRGAVLHPLALPPDLRDVDLGLLPERLTNEAAPSEWRRVVTVRGHPGVASVEGPAAISWSEQGIVYWLSSPTRSTDELITIADDMR